MPTLYEQMSPMARDALAVMLGFQTDKARGLDSTNTKGFAGFRNALRAIPALPEGFTMGDALRAYLAYIGELYSARGGV